VFVLEIFHKYDGFIYPKPGTFSWIFSSVSVMSDRRDFFRIFFPKWSGFFINSFDEKIQPVEALEKLERLEEDVLVFWTSTSKYPRRHRVDNHGLKLWEVCA
jgi:hypothetical protein